MRREVGREARTGSVGWDGRGRREERKKGGGREREGRKGGGKNGEGRGIRGGDTCKYRKGAGGREGEIKQGLRGRVKGLYVPFNCFSCAQRFSLVKFS